MPYNQANMDERDNYFAPNYQNYQVPVTPPGLEAIYSACRKLYADQPNPLQVTALVKYWFRDSLSQTLVSRHWMITKVASRRLGGPDPLDYISMYANPGDPEQGIPPHWHYISFGMSDLHGDGRVHESQGTEGPSGFGFELTFRLKREPGETNPPTWPATLMQALARYVFQTENKLYSGDHVPWHMPLDGSESRIQHMLMADDPQLHPITTPFGTVSFVQIVGVCAEELRAAQHWNGPGVIELLRSITAAGGLWLITDMRRGESLFEIGPSLQEKVDSGIESEGSNLSGVNSKCQWEEPGDGDRDSLYNKDAFDDDDEERGHISIIESEQIKATLSRGLQSRLRGDIGQFGKPRSRKNSFDSTGSSEADAPTELLRTRTLEYVHLKFNLEAASLLPLALRGRLKHGRHFTFMSATNDSAITLVSPSVNGSIADEEHPFAVHGLWLQVLLADDFIEEMCIDLEELSNPDEMLLPKTYRWPERRLCITILPDEA